MRYYKRLLGLALLACLVLSGIACTTTMTGISPSTTPITANDSYTKLSHTTGHAWGVLIYGIPLTENNQSKLAVERAIKNGGGNALIEVSEDSTYLNLLYGGILWTTINGTAVSVKRGGGNPG